jgi:cytochrome c5
MQHPRQLPTNGTEDATALDLAAFDPPIAVRAMEDCSFGCLGAGMAVSMGKGARALLGSACLLAWLGACSDKAVAPVAAGAQAQAQAKARVVALDPALQSVYQRSCAVCHAQSSTGAPLAGDRAEWAPRIAKGRDVLLEHTIDGFNGMPPLGACQECDEDQFVALIEYMANARLEDK